MYVPGPGRGSVGCGWQGCGMGMMKKAGAFAVAKKVYDEARKPHNQAKIKEAARKLQERRQRPR